MKKWMIFVAGVQTGAIWATIVFLLLPRNEKKTDKVKPTETIEPPVENKENPDIKMFDQPGEAFDCKSFKVFQVVADGAALVNMPSEYDMYLGPVCLLINYDGKYYYDDEIVKVPQGKVPRQVGVFRYETRSESDKTVPIIVFMDK